MSEQKKRLFERKEFHLKKGKFEIGGFTSPQDNIGVFNEEQEIEYVKECHNQMLEIFANPNKFEKRIAKMEHIPLVNPATTKLYSNVIFTDRNDYYCVGSGGIGGGKVFWTPYTIEDAEKRKKVMENEICDNCRTATHENLNHGIGGNAEFEMFSELPMIYLRLKEFPEENQLGDYIENLAFMTLRSCRKASLAHWERKVRNILYAVNERFPTELRRILHKRKWQEADMDAMFSHSCQVKSEEE